MKIFRFLFKDLIEYLENYDNRLISIYTSYIKKYEEEAKQIIINNGDMISYYKNLGIVKGFKKAIKIIEDTYDIG